KVGVQVHGVVKCKVQERDRHTSMEQHGIGTVNKRSIEALSYAVLLRRVGRGNRVFDALGVAEAAHLAIDKFTAAIRMKSLDGH
ncbi:hypothetical protein GGI06_001791, partial [Coemansia sp. S85]